jgi:Membrane bound FAD containing D-sorbitol dehydrogenase
MTDVIDDFGGVSRRKVLKLAGMFAGVSLVSCPTGAALAAAPVDMDFIEVSKTLTSKLDLSDALGSALLAAFRKVDPSFDVKMAQLRRLIGDAPSSGDALKAKLAGASADLAALSQSILTGWYLGTVGSGEKTICVAYVEALANRAVADVLRPQSYSYGAYGSWANKPA